MNKVSSCIRLSMFTEYDAMFFAVLYYVVALYVSVVCLYTPVAYDELNKSVK